MVPPWRFLWKRELTFVEHLLWAMLQLWELTQQEILQAPSSHIPERPHLVDEDEGPLAGGEGRRAGASGDVRTLGFFMGDSCNCRKDGSHWLPPCHPPDTLTGRELWSTLVTAAAPEQDGYKTLRATS